MRLNQRSFPAWAAALALAWAGCSGGDDAAPGSGASTDAARPASAASGDAAKGAELYAGLMLRYAPEEVDGLPVDTFCEALAAEGVRCGANVFRTPEHMRSIFTRQLSAR